MSLNILRNIIKVRYLRVAKYDLDKAAERIEQYFALQREWPELYSKFRLDLKYKNHKLLIRFK